MVSETLGGHARDTIAAVGGAGRNAVRSVLTSTIVRALTGAPTAHQLIIIPQDLRTADPSFASELYDGYFGLAGTVALTGSESPYTIQPPSLLWQKELYGLGWLNNLEAARDEIAREKARSLVAGWIAHSRHAPPIAWDIDIVAHRVISLLSHAGFLLEGAKTPFYESVMKALTHELHYLTDQLYRSGRHRAASARAHRPLARRSVHCRAADLCERLSAGLQRGARTPDSPRWRPHFAQSAHAGRSAAGLPAFKTMFPCPVA